MHKLFAFAALFFAALSVSAQRVELSADALPMQQGAYQPTWEGLSQFETPAWFRDAKFGIWAHWGPQCVEGSGDWMARGMYEEGSGQYNYHVEHYGHPSEFGFKDLLPLFKAEHWKPQDLVAYYKKIGARYFVALANHHDNFDLWDSKYQPWNSKNIGAHRDILAEWAAAAHAAGLPFGISIHADHAWTFYETAQRYDLKGPKRGVNYDGTLTKADGKGKWWDGLDPQMLYAQNHKQSQGSWSGMLDGQWDWGNGAALPSQAFVTNVYNRTLDAINHYQPDLVYFDATALPFYPVSNAGLRIAAHFYNQNAAAHGGKQNGVLLGKQLNDAQRNCLVWDVERGAPNKMIDQPWQTCTCLGNWHYNTSFYEQSWYKSAATVVKMLVDIVSKNGNMLLSVPLKADGTFDEKEKAILDEIGEWMTQNGACIYGSRPWTKFGEGPIAGSDIKLNAQGFNEGEFAKADAREIRFTTKGRVLYAIPLAWPENGTVTIQSLAKGKKKIGRVELLGYGKVKFTQTANGLTVTLPKPVNTIAPVLRIS